MISLHLAYGVHVLRGRFVFMKSFQHLHGFFHQQGRLRRAGGENNRHDGVRAQGPPPVFHLDVVHPADFMAKALEKLRAHKLARTFRQVVELHLVGEGRGKERGRQEGRNEGRGREQEGRKEGHERREGRKRTEGSAEGRKETKDGRKGREGKEGRK